jgi:hypothetical protein
MAGTEIGAKAGGFAFVQGSTWGTPVAVAANGGLKLTSYSENGGQESLENVELGDPAGSAPDIGNEGYMPEGNGKCRYGNFGRLLAYIFGTSGAPAQTGGGSSGSYLHTLTWADTLAKFMTAAYGFRAGAIPHEFPSKKINRISIAFDEGGQVTFKVNGVACSRKRASSTNTYAVFAAATVRAGRQQIMGTHATFRMNAQASGALASTTDDISIRGFELTIFRPMSVQHDTQSTAATEPFEDGPTEVEYTIKLRSYENDTYIALWEDLNSPTPKKADIKFLSTFTPSGSGSVPLYLQFDFPNCMVKAAPKTDVPGAGRIPHEVTFKCTNPPANTAPTGMTAVGPVQAFVMDEITTAYLA